MLLLKGVSDLVWPPLGRYIYLGLEVELFPSSLVVPLRPRRRRTTYEGNIVLDLPYWPAALLCVA